MGARALAFTEDAGHADAALKLLERRNDLLRARSGTDLTLRRRALTIRHALHVLPGQCVLEIAAGRGAWTLAVAEALGPDNRVTGVVFNSDLLALPEKQRPNNVEFVAVTSLSVLPPHSWDFVIGNGIVDHADGAAVLSAVRRLLKPGGKCFFLEEKRRGSPAAYERRVKHLFDAVAQQPSAPLESGHGGIDNSTFGFEEVAISRYAIWESCKPGRPTAWIAGLLESVPGFRDLSRTFCVSATAGGHTDAGQVPRLTRHPHLFGSTSVVIPSRNEASNLPGLIRGLLAFYDEYVFEIIIVNDNSTDETAAVVQALAAVEPRIKLLNRQPPGGVGRALREGYAAAGGRYILTMDADFIELLPDLRTLFDEIAAGRDGAIGSRFTQGSLLVQYPLAKLICNRALHLLLKIFVRSNIRDVSNNLKLYRSDILKTLDLEADGFAANLETGLKPLLRGYDIVEVPVSWINRTQHMGSSSFKLLAVGPAYLGVLFRALTTHGRLRQRQSWST